MEEKIDSRKLFVEKLYADWESYLHDRSEQPIMLLAATIETAFQLQQLRKEIADLKRSTGPRREI